MTNLEVITFNCRGVSNDFKRKKLFSFLHERQYDIICLQETHSLNQDEVLWKSQWGGQAFFCSHTSRSKGVAILFRPSLNVKVNTVFNDENGRFIILKIFIDDVEYILVNVYGPNEDNPEFFMDVFGSLEEIGNSNVIMAGDFNIAVGPLDYKGTRKHHGNVHAKSMFNLYVDEFNLIDVWREDHKGILGFTRQQQNPPVFSRLDYIFVSSELIGQVKHSEISSGICSDHSLVSVRITSGCPPRGKGYWKCNCYYLRHDPDFVKFIKDKIVEYKEVHKNSELNPNIVWDAFKCYIAGFCMEYSIRKKRERGKHKEDLLRKISEAKLKLSRTQKDPLGDNNSDTALLFREIQELENDLNDILDKETAGLIVRSRIKWAEHGERSSKYFCNLEKRNNEKKIIRQLKSREGNVLVETQKILEEIGTSFESLYSSDCSQEDIDIASLFLSGLDVPRINSNERDLLNAPISKSELWATLKSMSSNKTPGLDGLPTEFYVVFFNDIADMLLDSFNFSFSNGLLSNSQRNGVITLLLKQDKDPLEIKSYRPISLLNVDYKLVAKVMSHRLKKVINSLIHTDQQGFLSGRNISANVRTIIDLIEYTDAVDVPGSIVLLDFEKAFDRIEHAYLFKALEQFDLGDSFINIVKTFYNCRFSYVINNGYLTKPFPMNRGIFQGCPISPYLFVLAIEMLATAIRVNPDIKGIRIGELEKKVGLFADDTICFLNGETDSFLSLFELLNYFESFSGCRINMSKSEAINIGSLKNSEEKPFEERGLTWRSRTFKALGVTFSLQTKSLYELNYPMKLKKIEQVMNCWKQRSLSLIGKIAVVKSLLLPQLLYLFSVLCIDVPKSFFKKLDKLLYKFIWNNGNDRVKRVLLCDLYEEGGLKMIDPSAFAKSQKIVWVKNILDDKYVSSWKYIEIEMLKLFHKDPDMLWKAEAPPSVLKKLNNCQLSETLSVWYEYRFLILKELNLNSYHMQDYIWYNKNVSLRHRTYFYYHAWYERGIVYVSDLWGYNMVKTFEDLVLEFDIPITDRRKYNSLMNGLYLDWFIDLKDVEENVFDKIVSQLLGKSKLPKYAYSVFRNKDHSSRVKVGNKWEDWLGLEKNEVEWSVIHKNNFKCTIETQLRSFYFKVFHNAIGLNSFLYKIGRSESPLCYFCQELPETLIHVFCKCTVVAPMWKKLSEYIDDKLNETTVYPDFAYMFGIDLGTRHDLCINFLFLCLKFYIIRCKFQQVQLDFQSFISFVKMKQKIEYRIAEKKGKLSSHFKKWSISFI